jgi:DNA-binding CsgD family transcriptional regulator
MNCHAGTREDDMDHPDSLVDNSRPSTSVTSEVEDIESEHIAHKKLDIIKYGERDHIFIDLHIFFTVIGCSLLLAWSDIVVYGLMALPDISSTDSITFVAVFIACITITLLVGWRFPRIYSNGGMSALGVIVGVASFATLLGFWLPSYQNTFYFSCIAWGVVGIGVSALFGLWSDLIATQKSGSLRSFVSLSMLLAAVQVLFVMLLRIEFLRFFSFLIPVASLVICYLLRRSTLLSKRMAHMSKKETVTQMTISWQSLLSTVASGTLLGFSISWLLHVKASVLIIIAIAVITCLVDGLIFIDINTKKYFSESIFTKVFPVIALFGLLPAVFFDDMGRTICMALVCAASTIFAISVLAACFEHIVLNHQSPPNASAYGRFFNYLGIALGLVAGIIAFQTNMFGENTAAIFIVIIVVLEVVVTLFVMAENRFPIDEKSDTEFFLFQAEQILKNNPNATQEDIDRAVMKGKRVWKMRCDKVAEQYDLSSRQIEVFRLLSKGRNAEYITDALVISPHTTKAHIYSIYQKLGVHSRQELISLIERTEIVLDSDDLSSSDAFSR